MFNQVNCEKKERSGKTTSFVTQRRTYQRVTNGLVGVRETKFYSHKGTFDKTDFKPSKGSV